MGLSQASQHDRNFDDLADQFARRVYGGSKGRIRLALLERDLREAVPTLYDEKPRLRILDAGGGEGQFSQTLAALGHSVDLCDLSAVMVARAQERVNAAGLSDRMRCFQAAVQDVEPAPGYEQGYDLVLFHAVLEWVADPHAVLQDVLRHVRPGGQLSLMFYNLHSTVFRSVLRGFWDRVLAGDLKGRGKGLTPISPLVPDDVLDWLAAAGLDIQVRSGVRVFHDYLHHDMRKQQDNEAALLELELRYSRQEPFRSLARYYHVIARKPE
ncbi:MAG TPA: methyltransferase domain-containing protein [Dongiaceae bacterium]|nr:methyltransferase domain-containing protein [Dongiaceae bacterium]